MASMFLCYGGIGDVPYYVWSAYVKGHWYTYSHADQEIVVVIRRELSQACDTRAFFSSVFVPLILF